MKTIIIDLTKQQREQLQEFYNQVYKDFEAGKPGMIIGQLAGQMAKVGYIPQPFARRLSEIIKECYKTQAEPGEAEA